MLYYREHFVFDANYGGRHHWVAYSCLLYIFLEIQSDSTGKRKWEILVWIQNIQQPLKQPPLCMIILMEINPVEIEVVTQLLDTTKMNLFHVAMHFIWSQIESLYLLTGFSQYSWLNFFCQGMLYQLNTHKLWYWYFDSECNIQDA